MRTTILLPVLALVGLSAALLPLDVTIGAAHAQIAPWPVTLTMTGPATAVSGQEIRYRVHYRLTDPATISQTGFQIHIPANTTYISSEAASGPAGILLRLEEGFAEWGGLGNAEQPEGDVEMIVKIDADFVGSIATQANEPGTETASSNIVETQVFAPGTLPEAGSGGLAAASGSLVGPALLALALVGAALICAGAAARGMMRAR